MSYVPSVRVPKNVKQYSSTNKPNQLPDNAQTKKKEIEHPNQPTVLTTKKL